MIREAEIDDIPLILKRVKYLFSHKVFDGYKFDDASAVITFRRLIEHKQGVVLLSDKGALGASVSPYLFNSDLLKAVANFWTDDVSLVAAFEAWARKMGARECYLCVVQGRRERGLERLYSRWEYQPFEKHYVRQL